MEKPVPMNQEATHMTKLGIKSSCAAVRIKLPTALQAFIESEDGGEVGDEQNRENNS